MIKMSSKLKNWSDATWWLDDHHVGLEWNYQENKLEVTYPDNFTKLVELDELMKKYGKELKRFILETDEIRRRKDAEHQFDSI